MSAQAPMLDDRAPLTSADGWFVYLLALADCSAFKVGFSCNPLQRLHTFSRRYFERFDLGQSFLLQLGSEADARAIEATVKSELAEFRADCPSWVPEEAGGYTEWSHDTDAVRSGNQHRARNPDSLIQCVPVISPLPLRLNTPANTACRCWRYCAAGSP